MPAIELLDAALVDIESDNIHPGPGKGNRDRQPDVAQAYDSDAAPRALRAHEFNSDVAVSA
jgi:hypothetical protein